jgi:hypothetical protein
MSLVRKADRRMSPTERKTIWPAVAAVLKAEGSTTVQILREFANILDTVPDAHKAEFLAMSAGMAGHCNRASTTPGSSVQANETVVLAPGLSEFEDESDSTDSESDNETESAYSETEPGSRFSDDTRTMAGDTDDTRTMTGDTDGEQGASVRGPRDMREYVEGLDGNNLTWIESAYLKNLRLKLHIDDTTRGSPSLLENLRRKIFFQLKGLGVHTRNQSTPKLEILTPLMAHNISKLFFKDMVDPVAHRVHDIIQAQANESMAQAGAQKGESLDPRLPRTFKLINRSLAKLIRTDAKSNAISTLEHQIELYRLSNVWGQIKDVVSEIPVTAEGAEILALCPPPSKGISNVSRAAAGIYNDFGMDKEVFFKYLKNAALPSSLVQVFGAGGIMFAKPNWYVPPSRTVFTRRTFLANDLRKHSGRSNIIPASGATQIFGVIKDADTEGVLQHMATSLQSVVVDPIWNDEPIAWDAKKLVGLNRKLPLLSLLAAMSATTGN